MQLRRLPKALKIAWLVSAFALSLVTAGQAGNPKYQEETAKHYNLRFGKGPWLPSQAHNENDEFVPANDFPKAEYCAQCHEEAHKQWRESAHSNSFRAPFYVRNINLLINSKGIEYTRHCEGCHNPIALFSGSLTKGSKVDRSFDKDGVTCMVCHSIQRIQNTSGTGSYVMGTPTVMLDEAGKPMPGKVSFDQILAHPERHSKAVMKDFYRTPEFCSACHKAAVPKLLNDYKWLRAFTVYDEWQNSSWAKESPLPFYKKDTVSSCQTCHMKQENIVASDMGAKNGMLKSHRWLGANTATPTFYGFDEQLKRTMAYLQNDLLAIDFFALNKGATDEVIAPIDRSDFTIAPGEELTVGLYIQNKGIGHSLVPEQRDFYESWVEFKVTNADGKVITHSGYLKPDGFLDERAHSFTNRLISKEGKLLDLHQVWQTRTRAFDTTILPGRSELIRYRFTVPQGATGPLKVEARVNYRRFRQGWLDYALQKKGMRYPIAQMASKQMTLNVGQNAASTEPQDGQKEMLRWNNYGIALLGQQQYSNAAQVFTRVTQMKPDYVDGYINVAIANFMYEKYAPAMKMLDTALEKSPNNARALFYRASILRLQGKLDEAIEDFKAVIAQYPRFRDAQRELAFSYYQQKKYDLARRHYELVQEVDPDDLSAHYNLMIVYRRLGLKDKAAEQEAFFRDRKDDPTANSVALDFLRSNPQIQSESVPWHVHTDGPGGGGRD